jgi:hypothetical protein
MEIPGFVFLGVLLVVFIGGGLVIAFIADRRRNEEVAHDQERTAPDPNADRDPTSSPEPRTTDPSIDPSIDPGTDRP